MQSLPFGLGLVEGFYGRLWNDADRIDCLRFLATVGYRYYLYAPKGDPILRRHWRDRWNAADERRMHDLARCCADNGLVWGFGLSPPGLVEDFSAGNRRLLRDKVRYLQDFGPQIQCVLFDDMPRTISNLASRQIDVFSELMGVADARHALVCPSYYSTDPVLERLFGSMPTRYWEDLGEGLPPEAGIFWTGETVCAESQNTAALQRIAARLGRRPVLWDNYPVNDGAKGSAFLRIDAFRGRSSALAGATQAHFVNPMNQCWLSRIPLATLALLYAEGDSYCADSAFRRCAIKLCGEQLGAMLVEDLDAFQREGLGRLPDARRAQLLARYRGTASPYAAEIVEWLDGCYAFDPACLTD